MVGQKPVGKVIDKLVAKTGEWKYNAFPSLESVEYSKFLYSVLDSYSFNYDKVCILSPTVPYNICDVMINYFGSHVTLVGKHPGIELCKEEFLSLDNITIVCQNIFDYKVNDHIEKNDIIILHDFQYMMPLKYLRYKLKGKKVIILSSDQRFSHDEHIKQNFDGLDIEGLTFVHQDKRANYYCTIR
jgi:hypothetical protein